MGGAVSPAPFPLIVNRTTVGGGNTSGVGPVLTN